MLLAVSLSSLLLLAFIVVVQYGGCVGIVVCVICGVSVTVAYVVGDGVSLVAVALCCECCN